MPCPANASGTLSFNTAQIPDGPHHLRLLVTDPAGNVAASDPIRIKTSNNPCSPLPAVSGMTLNAGFAGAKAHAGKGPASITVTYAARRKVVGTLTSANGTSIGVADVDSTEEMQVLTGNYDAEYGRASGAQIRIVTKGGSNQFHGAAYEYLIKYFADSAGKKGGEFYTPGEVVRLLVQLVKPQAGDTIYDPTVGSGGFLIQSHQYVEEQGEDANDLALY